MENKNINGRVTMPTILKGITPEQIKEIAQSQRRRNMVPTELASMPAPKKIINGKKNFQKKALVVKGIVEKIAIPRPEEKYLTNLAVDVTRIVMPEQGSFNPGLAKIPNSDKYVMVYRPHEYGFVGCILDKTLKVESNSYFKFSITNCADPRLLFLPDGRLLMIYSSTTKTTLNYECIRGCIIMDINKSYKFIDNIPFRVSPETVLTRQKNWMPFLYENRIYLIASVCPHIVYELTLGETIECKQTFETEWVNPWFFPKDFLRGNTNPVQLDDGNYLGTFHTAVWNGSKCYYDNGCYLFEGKPPFKVLKCSNRTYLPAEGAIEKHFRNAKTIVCTFPVGMVRNNKEILISYGDNDSIVKIMRTTVDDMCNLMLDVY